MGEVAVVVLGLQLAYNPWLIWSKYRHRKHKLGQA